MSSLKSYFRKKHRYETQADLKNMTAEQIVNIDPKDVGFYIEQETGGVPLEGVKKRQCGVYYLLRDTINLHQMKELDKEQ